MGISVDFWLPYSNHEQGKGKFHFFPILIISEGILARTGVLYHSGLNSAETLQKRKLLIFQEKMLHCMELTNEAYL